MKKFKQSLVGVERSITNERRIPRRQMSSIPVSVDNPRCPEHQRRVGKLRNFSNPSEMINLNHGIFKKFQLQGKICQMAPK